MTFKYEVRGLKFFIFFLLIFSNLVWSLPSEEVEGGGKVEEEVSLFDTPLFNLSYVQHSSLDAIQDEFERIKSNTPLLETVLGQRKSKNARPILGQAVSIPRMDLVEFLIGEGAVIEAQDVKEAVLQENIEMFKLLLNRKIKTDPSISTQVLFWIQYEKPSAMLFLQECFRFEVDASSRIEGKISPIHLAARQMNVPAVGSLASNGFDINAQDANQLTAGHWMLLYAKKNPDSLPKENREGVIWGLRALAVMGIDWSLRNKNDRNVLEESFTTDGFYEISRSLIEGDKIDFNDKNSRGENSLFSAIRNRRYKEALLMIDRKADVNNVNHLQETPIQIAASIEEFNKDLSADLNELALVLIEKTLVFNLRLKDQKGKNVMYHFIENNFSISVIESIVKRMGTDYQDDSGRAPMDYISRVVQDGMDTDSCQKQLGFLQ